MRSKKADYIYVERIAGERNYLHVEEVEIQKSHIIRIRQEITEATTENARRMYQLDKKLLCRMKKLWHKSAIVVGNERITKEWEMPNVLFRMRKQILLENKQTIFDRLCKEDADQQSDTFCRKRRSFLLVLDSSEWQYKDVENLLWEVQKRFEDIYVVQDRNSFFIDEMCDYFIEECGVIIHVLKKNDAKNMKFDTILFLVERLNNSDKEYIYNNRYVVEEWEENQFQSLPFETLDDTINVSMKWNR